MANGVIRPQSNVGERFLAPFNADDITAFIKAVMTSPENNVELGKTIILNTKWNGHNNFTFLISKLSSSMYSYFTFTATSALFGSYTTTTDTVIVRQVSYT